MATLEKKHPSCQKLLFSATLSSFARDPGKIATLELRKPKYFIVQTARASTSSVGDKIGDEAEAEGAVMDIVTEKFTMPATLKVYTLLAPLRWLSVVVFRVLTTIFTSYSRNT